MACWYAMNETGVPFGKMAIHGQIVKHAGTKPVMIEGVKHWDADQWDDPKPDVKPYINDFYTLRVCKACRAEWMLAIKNWFTSIPGSEAARVADEKAHPGMLAYEGKIPVRVLGATINANIVDANTVFLPPLDDD